MKTNLRHAFPAIALLAVCLVSCSKESGEGFRKEATGYWKGDVFSQSNIELADPGAGAIRARVDGKWQRFSVRELPDGFMKWKFSSRLKSLEVMKKGKMPSLSGHHFGAVASYGGHRPDTEFSVNNAFKGIGLVPKRERIKVLIEELESTWDVSQKEKIEVLKSLQDDEDSFDRTKLCSLELYTTKEFQTHTFLNIMANPSVAVVFLDMPSYEVRAICRLVHPEDETASKEEKDILKYVNLIHDYFHGKAPRRSIVMIFHVIQVFDNSPRSKGVRVVP